MKTSNDLMKGLSAKGKKDVRKLTKELIDEELTMRALRQARELTQVKVAEELGISQNAVSKLEKRSDFLVSTLSDYVEALGGRLKLVAEFPDSAPITLSCLADLDEGNKSPRTK
jgi:DNA-binding XRE family transcriptional regulator